MSFWLEHANTFVGNILNILFQNKTTAWRKKYKLLHSTMCRWERELKENSHIDMAKYSVLVSVQRLAYFSKKLLAPVMWFIFEVFKVQDLISSKKNVTKMYGRMHLKTEINGTIQTNNFNGVFHIYTSIK